MPPIVGVCGKRSERMKATRCSASATGAGEGLVRTVTFAHGGRQQHVHRPRSWEPSEELGVLLSLATSSVTRSDEAVDLPELQQQVASWPATAEYSKPLPQQVPSVQTTLPQHGADWVGSARPVPIRATQSRLVRNKRGVAVRVMDELEYVA